ncbi:MAG: SMC-Scp complex subunit ScpB, partial [Rhizobiales bacterium]|nr:SMC-Scp complex subunit ScpB [Hyphomicrobiales bacterium]
MAEIEDTPKITEDIIEENTPVSTVEAPQDSDMENVTEPDEAIESTDTTVVPFSKDVSANEVEQGTGAANNDDDKVDRSFIHEQIRMVEAIVFAASEPVSNKALKERMPDDCDLKTIMTELQNLYKSRGVNLVKIGGNWSFRTADDLGFILQKETIDVKKLSRAALEVLATIAY